MRPVYRLKQLLLFCFFVISVADAGRFIMLDENGDPYAGQPTCQRCEDYLANCPEGFFCACSCSTEELQRKKNEELQTLFFEKGAALKNSYSECMTDIYFGNGVWNDEFGARAGMIALFGEFYETGIFDEKKHHFGLAFNIGTSGSYNDIIETYWQLIESGQISAEIGFFSSMYRIMNAYEADSLITKGMRELKEYVDEKLPDIIDTLNTNYGTMFSKYQNISFKNGHRVLLVAHSQGNLFGNYMYGMFDWQKEYFRMIGLASPASYVAGGGPHITVRRDPIRLIPNNLEWNVEGHWHSFLGTYLAEKYSTPFFIEYKKISEALCGGKPGALIWSNLLKMDLERGKKYSRNAKSNEQIVSLSKEIFLKELEILKPNYIIFATSYTYDDIIKEFLADFITESEVIEKRSLWKFKVGDTTCFRTWHPSAIRYQANKSKYEYYNGLNYLDS